MKVALAQRLVNHLPIDRRAAVSSTLATFVAGADGVVQCPALQAFLAEQFRLHGIGLSPEPVAESLAGADFLEAFGYTDIFRSAIVHYLHRLCLALLRDPAVGRDAGDAVRAAFPQAEECVGAEFLPRLAALAARIVAAIKQSPATGAATAAPCLPSSCLAQLCS
jgi:hypothetical protein